MSREPDIFEGMLRQNPDFLRGLVQSHACIAWATDANLHFTAIEGLGLLPYKQGPEEIVGRSLRDYFPAEFSDSEMVIQAHRRALAGESVGYLLRVPEGRHYKSYVHPQRSPSGEILGCFGLAIDVTDGKESANRLRTKYLATRLLHESNVWHEAIPQILQSVCDTFAWDYGDYFALDHESGAFRFVAGWFRASCDLAPFRQQSEGSTFRIDDQSLPARVLRSGNAEWVMDIAKDVGFSRAASALQAGLRGAVAIPVNVGPHAIGVMEFFCRTPVHPDAEMSELIHAIAIQIGRTNENQRAEAELRAKEERFQAFMNNSPTLAFIKDAAGRYRYVNRPLEQAFGEPPGSRLGKTDEEIFPHHIAKQLRLNDQHVLAGSGAVELEESAPTHDGLDHHYLVFKFPFRNNRGELMLGGMGIDVTDRKEIARTRDETLALLDTLLTTAPLGLAYLDRNLRYVRVNPSLAAFNGFPSEEHLGKTIAEMVPGHAEKIEALCRHVLTTGEMVKDIEIRGRIPSSKRVIDVLTSYFPVRDRTGEILGVGVVVIDVTEKRALEQQFRQAQKMEAVGQLAGGIAHDFNNLLTIISGYSELAMGMLPIGNAVRDLIVQIHKAGERAASLTRQLLAFSRLQVLEPKVLNLNEIMRDMEKMLRRLIGEDVSLKTRIAEGLWSARLDAGQVEQVVLNLAVNARDAMPGGGDLTIATANETLSEDDVADHPEIRPGQYVMLTVTDSGAGMSPEVQAHIFEPFFTTKEPGKGTGLGLATVYGIVKQSGGYVHVQSEVGKGASFRLLFPAIREKAVAEAPKAKTDIARGSETILLAEDEPTLRDLLRFALVSQGYRVLEASNGVEAVRIAEEASSQIDLLVTDVVMPRMGGRSAAERLRLRYPAIKVLYMSGYMDDAVVRHGIFASQAHFIQKPFSAAALIQRIRELLDE